MKKESVSLFTDLYIKQGPIPQVYSHIGLSDGQGNNLIDYPNTSDKGQGQETVRNFFRAGGASGTIAKAMSAYDKDFSDAIYGAEKDGRVLCH